MRKGQVRDMKTLALEYKSLGSARDQPFSCWVGWGRTHFSWCVFPVPLGGVGSVPHGPKRKLAQAGSLHPSLWALIQFWDAQG